MCGNMNSRQIEFFGEEGQKKLLLNHSIIVGTGGVGSHVAQQLAFLGVGAITLIDGDHLEETNLNRLIGVKAGDPLGMPKVDIAERNILSIKTDIQVAKIQDSFITKSGFRALRQADIVFGCVDNDGARLVLNEFCLAYELPYIDIASDIMPDGLEYGGRIVSVFNDKGCLYCRGEIDEVNAGKDLENPKARKDREAIYGVMKDELGETGPSVVSINGVVASLAVTEFMLHFTGKRMAQLFLNYTGSRGIVNNRDKSDDDCYYCNVVRGQGDNANLYRYLRSD